MGRGLHVFKERGDIKGGGVKKERGADIPFRTVISAVGILSCLNETTTFNLTNKH